jgi:hypothetical protein
MREREKEDGQAYVASCTAWLPGALGKKNGLSGRQNNKLASFLTWYIACSIGGAPLTSAPGSGFR